MTTHHIQHTPAETSTAVLRLAVRVDRLMEHVDYRRDGEWQILVGVDGDVAYIQVRHERRDIVTGKMSWGSGGKYRVSEHATDSEIVQAVFGLFKAYEEHEVRENFYWRDRRIYGPHIDVRALAEVADRFDARPAVQS